jgi:hypothetical protein
LSAGSEAGFSLAFDLVNDVASLMRLLPVLLLAFRPYSNAIPACRSSPSLASPAAETLSTALRNINLSK